VFHITNTNNTNVKNNLYTVSSLFCGAGGLDMGFEMLYMTYRIQLLKIFVQLYIVQDLLVEIEKEAGMM
jgi:hypothetical protein